MLAIEQVTRDLGGATSNVGRPKCLAMAAIYFVGPPPKNFCLFVGHVLIALRYQYDAVVGNRKSDYFGE
jgi:hypothetical protein